MEIIRYIFLSILLLFLSNCSDITFSRTKEVFDLYVNQGKKPPKKIITTDMIADINYSIILVETNNIIQQMLLLPMTKRDNFLNYTSGSGQSLTMQNFLLSKTNGFNTYLISAEANKNSPLTNLIKLSECPQDDKLQYSFVTLDYRIKNFSFNCEYNLIGKENINILENNVVLNRVEQNCMNDINKFTNIYWANEKGKIIKSKQYLIYNKTFFTITKVKE